MGAILTEIALQFLGDIHSLVKTDLPYPWDFCRVALAEDTRLILNSGSYFVVYAAFIFWFIKYIVQNVKVLAREELTIKDYIIAVMLAFAAATQMLWPIFLISTWFITCSYYPWFTALLVLSLNFPQIADALLQFTAIKSRELLQASAETFIVTGLVRSEDEYSDEDPQRNEVNVEVESVRRERLPSDSLAQVVDTRSDTSLTVPIQSTPTRGRRIEERTIRGIVRDLHRPEISDFTDVSLITPTQDIVGVEAYRTTVPSVEYEEEEIFFDSSDQQRKTRMRQDQPITYKELVTEGNVRHREIRSERPHKAEGTSVRRRVRSTGTINKKGYCGRCWRVDGLPFMQGFSGLREPYTTRSGFIYGPPVRFLKMDEYMEQYGL